MSSACAHGRIADEERIYKLVSSERAQAFGQALDHYVFEQNWRNMMEAFRKRAFDEARTRAGIMLDWWTNPQCNPIPLDHHKRITSARMIGHLTAIPALAGSGQEILEAFAGSIENGSSFDAQQKVNPELQPYTDYLMLAGRSPLRKAADSGEANAMIAAWQSYLDEYPESPLYGEVLQNQMNLWVSTSLRTNTADELQVVAPPRENHKKPILMEKAGSYIVAQGDNYSRIAAAVQTDEVKLRALNRHVELVPGLILKIPHLPPPASVNVHAAVTPLVPFETPVPPSVAVDWVLPESLTVALAQKSRDHDVNGEHYLLDDMRLCRVLVAGSTGDTTRTKEEIRLLFSETSDDGCLRFIDRLLGSRTGSYESFKKAKAIAVRWTPIPKLEKGDTVTRFQLGKYLPELDHKTLETFSSSDLFALGTFHGDSFEYLLARLFEQKTAATRISLPQSHE